MAEMMPKMAHSEPLIGFEIGPPHMVIDFPGYFQNFREIPGNPRVAEMSLFSRANHLISGPNLGIDCLIFGDFTRPGIGMGMAPK